MPNLFKLFKVHKRQTGWCVVAIGNAGVHLVQVQNLAHQPIVKQCIYHQVENLDSDSLEKILKEYQIGEPQFSTLLSSGEYQLLMVDAPNVPVNELKTAVRWKIKDTLNYPVDDATIDVVQIPGNNFGSDRPQSLYAVAASNETIRKRISLFENAKMDLSVIDIPEMAQRNLAALFETEGRGLVLLTFSDEGGLLTFTSNGELLLARRIEISLGQLQDADHNLRMQFMDRVELEVQRSLDYFDRQFHHITISRILVSAPEAIMLDTILAKHLELPIERLDLAQVMDISAVPALIDSEYLCHALHPLGAALRQEGPAL
jgi:MSHA biogenesis protein MshI